jgi:hypothetical protein
LKRTGRKKAVIMRIWAFLALYVLFLYAAGTSTLAREPFLEILSPREGDVWTEGETRRISWRSEGIDRVGIAVAVGGKDRGHLTGAGGIEARSGHFDWTIPGGFVTGFGVSRSDQVRVMVYDLDRSSHGRVSGPFTIRGAGAADAGGADREGSGGDEDDPFAAALRSYYRAVDEGRYRQAYAMLSRCGAVLTDAGGSAVSYRPRPEYASWERARENIRSLKVVEVKRLAPPGSRDGSDGSAAVTMGVRLYRVELDLELGEEGRGAGSGRNTRFAALVRGSDGEIRILGIGTGP